MTRIAALLVAITLTGCGDRCSTLCDDVGKRLSQCRGTTPWADFPGAPTGRRDFVSTCQRNWDTTSAALTSREQQLALEECAQSHDTLDTLTCDEVMALYLPSP